MRWFGDDWGAPICKSAERAETPVGVPCASCRVPIEGAFDPGLLIPTLVSGVWTELPVHWGCFLVDVGAFVEVHVLAAGQALCGIPGPPSSWPIGHRWTSAIDGRARQWVTCQGCKSRLRDAFGAVH
jgi:hypothetical protein